MLEARKAAVVKKRPEDEDFAAARCVSCDDPMVLADVASFPAPTTRRLRYLRYRGCQARCGGLGTSCEATKGGWTEA